MTPNVGMTWKLSWPSKTNGSSVRLAPIPRSVAVMLAHGSLKETSTGLTVENHVAFIIDELRSFGLQLLSFFNCGEVFVAVR